MNKTKLSFIGLLAILLTGCVVPSFPTNPTSAPTSIPTSEPTTIPTSEPTTEPTSEPTSIPTSVPTSDPTSVEPTTVPTSESTSVPTSEPTYVPTSEPTTVPTSEPTYIPTSEPTTDPTSDITSEPTSDPTYVSTSEPTTEPTSEPTYVPTSEPTTAPTSASTSQPTTAISTSMPVDTSSGTLPDPVIEYYASIDDELMGEELLNALRALNAQKRTSTVGYSAMGTSPSGQYKYTDYDPDTVKYDANGQPYGTACISFYSGHTMISWNREHVWPNTHGGNLVEADIHMPRPTIPSENGSRGHSFFIEGMKSNKNEGWDPAMESFGEETYRGDSARIIFYCMIATNQLTLTDDGSRSANTKNKEMGVISDMLSWNLRYEVLQREQNRNAGAQYLQGNRNPFIDHPEYACRIWGTTNDKTRQICGM